MPKQLSAIGFVLIGEPPLVAAVKHFGWTGNGALRAGVLQGLLVESV